MIFYGFGGERNFTSADNDAAFSSSLMGTIQAFIGYEDNYYIDSRTLMLFPYRNRCRDDFDNATSCIDEGASRAHSSFWETGVSEIFGYGRPSSLLDIAFPRARKCRRAYFSMIMALI